MNFVCPKCALPLFDSGGAVKCENGHSFDRARSGYYNLLLSGGGTHGDNTEMVKARRKFLSTDLYRPLADKIAEVSSKYANHCLQIRRNAAEIPLRLLDIGCGEGYYTEIIAKKFLEEKVPISASAFDISRDAVKYAAKRCGELCEFAVASAYRMPVSDGGFDMVLNIFSPLALDEIERALIPGGIFIMAIPGREHLFGLKSAAYEKPYKNEVRDARIEGFSLLESAELKYSVTLSEREQISSLFMMTPYAYRTREEDKARVLSLEKLTTDVEFCIFVYEKDVEKQI